MRKIITNFDTLIKLPIPCKKILSKEITEKNIKNLKKLFELTKANGKLGLKYSMKSYDTYSNCKLPTVVWKTKSGHCFELSLFLLACLKYLGFNAYYYEMPNFKKWDHACVLIKVNGKSISVDLGRKIFNAKYKGYNRLTKKQTLGNYFINCAHMLYPWKCKSKKLSKKDNITQRQKAIKFAKLGLKYYPNSKRGKIILTGD
ncbi:MAG: hypothetical protein PHH82_04395 [Candidatus ainarchaeum sp.]|nr:hypothetical protein [Candidatus ainarchaeum sp.]